MIIHRIDETPKEPLKEIDIYVLISQISDEFYVGKTKKGNAYNAYKEHARYRKKSTKELFERSEEEARFPQMYLLGTVISTEKGAFQHCVAWTKYFVDRSFTALAGKKTMDYVDDLLPETENIFSSIKSLETGDVLADDKLIVATYKKKSKSEKRTPKDEISFSVSKKEYEKILTKAEENGLSMSRYCKNMVLSGQIVKLEPQPFWQYIAAVRDIKITIKQIAYSIETTGKYYPADIENVMKAVDKMAEIERDRAQAVREYTKAILKLLPK